MSAKTERITILGSPDFKAFLTAEAKKEGVSVSHFVRSRCEGVPPNNDEVVLQDLIKIAADATKKASASLGKSVKEAESVLAELRAVH